jgi:hypothetical protein
MNKKVCIKKLRNLTCKGMLSRSTNRSCLSEKLRNFNMQLSVVFIFYFYDRSSGLYMRSEWTKRRSCMILSVMPADVVEQVNICGNPHDDLPCLHLFHAGICSKKNIFGI